MSLICGKVNDMDKLQKFFSDNWAVQRCDLERAASLLLPCIITGNLQGAAEQLNVSKCKAQAASPNVAQWYELDDLNLPAGSVAVITLKGILYSWETEWLIRQIERADQNPNICGIVLEIDGPGGMVAHVDRAADCIAACSKPTATVVTGTMASAHFWLGIATDRTFIASTLCEVGSVGVVFTYYSFKQFFEQNGIKHFEIYPDSADLKNKEIRALEDNDDENPLKERAARIHQVFSETVAKNLNIDYNPELPLFRGEMFTADEAVAAGYIDQRGGMADAVQWVIAQALKQEINKLY